MQLSQETKNQLQMNYRIVHHFKVINLVTKCEKEYFFETYSNSGKLNEIDPTQFPDQSLFQREPCYHPSTEPYEIGHCKVDPHSRSIYVHGEQRKMTSIGFRMFDYLCQRKNQLIKKSEIARDVWGLKNAPVDFSSINNFSNKIRKILSTDSGLRLDSGIELNLKLEEDETVAHKD